MEKQASHMSTAEFSSATGVPVKKITAWLRKGTCSAQPTAGEKAFRSALGKGRDGLLFQVGKEALTIFRAKPR